MPNDPSSISAEIKALRESFRESQDAFAIRCNLTQPQISEIENEKYIPGTQTLRSIARGCGKVAVLGAKNGKVFVDPGK